MTGPTAISVVIPCYNGARFLSETLTSVLNQTHPASEIIVIDDGSTDDSAAIAASFGPAVRVLRQANQGESVARNRGIALAQGDWVALLDADDYWEPQKLMSQIEVALGLPASFVCVYTDYYRFDRTKRASSEPRPEYHAQPDARVRLLFDWCIQPSSALIRRDALRTVRFPETVRFGEDIIFFAVLRGQGPFVRIAEELTGYRLSASQQTKRRDHYCATRRSLFRWFAENAACYSQADCDYFYSRFKHELVDDHDNAYWARRHARVRECRALFAELFAQGEAPPLSFRKRVFPTPLCWIKDWIDRILSKHQSSLLEI